jgi:RimJ/RimL family protein N-acetyltransferase
VISQIDDMAYIKKMVTHEKVWRWVSDDRSDISTYEPDESCVYLGAFDGETAAGFFMVKPINGISLEIHTVISPDFWGEGVRFAKEVIFWIFQNTDFLKIVTFIPENNVSAIRLAINSGLSQEGVVKKSFLKNGIILDQFLFGVSKGDICQ